MSRTPCLEQLLRDREHPPLRHARAAERARVAQDQHRVGVDVQRGVVDARGHVVVVLEDDGAGPCAVSSDGDAAECLMTQPSGASEPRRIARPPSAKSGFDARADDVVVEDLGARERLARRVSPRPS